MKVLIFDSGPLINLSMNGLLYILEELKKVFDGRFIIPEQVRYEVVDRPIKIPRFELGALKIRGLIEDGILEMPGSLDIDKEQIIKETLFLMSKANKCINAKDNWLHLISEAETSCLAVSSELTRRGVENMIAIDERTTRVLTEKPENLEKLMSKKLHSRVVLSGDLSDFKNFRFIRSTELVYVAYKKGLLRINGSEVLEAVLYATKYMGSSVSFEEIDELKKLKIV